MDLPSRYIDSHVHVWTNDLRRYPLAPEFTAQDMVRDSFLPTEMLDHARQIGVDRAVLVQMSYYGFDNSFMLDVIRENSDTFRGIAVVDWTVRQSRALIRRLAAGGVRGFRIELKKYSSSSLLDHHGLDHLFRLAANERMAICPLLEPGALAAVHQFCHRHRETTVVIDHLAGIGDGAPPAEADVSALCSLARLPNVNVKLSGFYAVGNGPPHHDMLWLIKRVYEAFGPERLMWGSDVPFQMITETYEDSISLIRDHLDFASTADRNRILRGTTERIFFQ
jgi:predicted TIM-barrel fold metal-dependent hydrolase